MPVKAKIALCEPFSEQSDQYFSVKLKQYHYVEPTEYEKPSKLLIVNNIQGDFKFFRTFLLKARIIDKSYNWIFGDGHLVIAGNCFGENEMSVECLWLIYALEQRAQYNGGYVHFILGKNEIVNINGAWQYAPPQYSNNQRTSKAPYVVLYDGNSELRRWIQTKNIIEKIGRIIISHTDISSEFSSDDLSLTQLNALVRQYYSRMNEAYKQPLVAKILYKQSMPLFNNDSNQQNIIENQVKTTHHGLIARKIAGLAYIYTSMEGIIANKANILMIRNNRFYFVNPEGEYARIHLTH